MSAYHTNPGKVVDAQKIAGFTVDSKTTIQYVILEDGHREPRPLVHGFAPMVGDYLVTEGAIVTRRKDGSSYAEKSETYIVPAGYFNTNFIPVEDPAIVEAKDSLVNHLPMIQTLIAEGTQTTESVTEPPAAELPEIVEIPPEVSSEVKER